jgi:hypothetical protein
MTRQSKIYFAVALAICLALSLAGAPFWQVFCFGMIAGFAINLVQDNTEIDSSLDTTVDSLETLEELQPKPDLGELIIPELRKLERKITVYHNIGVGLICLCLPVSAWMLVLAQTKLEVIASTVMLVIWLALARTAWIGRSRIRIAHLMTDSLEQAIREQKIKESFEKNTISVTAIADIVEDKVKKSFRKNIPGLAEEEQQWQEPFEDDKESLNESSQTPK